MKKTFTAILILIYSFTLVAQTPELKFNKDGKFKIVQFTDTHYDQANPESAVTIELIEEVLELEKPDLVVFTGDIVWSTPASKVLDEVFAPVIEKKMPFAYIFGNHDDEFDWSRQQLMDYTTQKAYNLSASGDKSLFGVGNYILEIKSEKSDKNAALVYFFDSGAYSLMDSVSGYDWLKRDQVNWYAEQSAAYTKENNGNPYPALAFFHIPLAEYPIMKADKYDELIGSRDEEECNGRINPGMFEAMKQAGDIMGTFVGHEHDNDYIGEYYGIYLAYGRYSGGKTVYNNLGKNGCRVITLEEGKKEFNTYIRLLGDETIYPVHYPTTFPIRKK